MFGDRAAIVDDGPRITLVQYPTNADNLAADVDGQPYDYYYDYHPEYIHALTPFWYHQSFYQPEYMHALSAIHAEADDENNSVASTDITDSTFTSYSQGAEWDSTV